MYVSKVQGLESIQVGDDIHVERARPGSAGTEVPALGILLDLS